MTHPKIPVPSVEPGDVWIPTQPEWTDLVRDLDDWPAKRALTVSAVRVTGQGNYDLICDAWPDATTRAYTVEPTYEITVQRRQPA